MRAVTRSQRALAAEWASLCSPAVRVRCSDSVSCSYLLAVRTKDCQ